MKVIEGLYYGLVTNGLVEDRYETPKGEIVTEWTYKGQSYTSYRWSHQHPHKIKNNTTGVTLYS